MTAPVRTSRSVGPAGSVESGSTSLNGPTVMVPKVSCTVNALNT